MDAKRIEDNIVIVGAAPVDVVPGGVHHSQIIIQNQGTQKISLSPGKDASPSDGMIVDAGMSMALDFSVERISAVLESSATEDCKVVSWYGV